MAHTCHAQPGLLVYRYTYSSGSSMKETGGSPEFPRHPCRYMPRTMIPAVTSCSPCTNRSTVFRALQLVDFHRQRSVGYPCGPQLYIFRDSITQPTSLFPLCFEHPLSEAHFGSTTGRVASLWPAGNCSHCYENSPGGYFDVISRVVTPYSKRPEF